MTLTEVENTVNLFANLVDNATDISDLKEDACAELARRCKNIQDNLSKTIANMSKEEERNKAISVSEALQKALDVYRSSLESSHIVSSIPIFDSISLHSDNKRYERARRNLCTRSRDRYFDPQRRTGRYDDSSDSSRGERDVSRARDREREREELERASGDRELDRANRERELICDPERTTMLDVFFLEKHKSMLTSPQSFTKVKKNISPTDVA